MKNLQQSQNKILLIGEANEQTTAIRASIEVAGHVVVHAGTVKAAEIALEQAAFGLIVVDCDSRESVVKSISEFTSLLSPKTPTIGYTTSRSQTLVMEVMRNGAVDVLCLPRDLAVVKDRVESTLSKNHNAKLEEKRNKDVRRLYEELEPWLEPTATILVSESSGLLSMVFCMTDSSTPDEVGLRRIRFGLTSCVRYPADHASSACVITIFRSCAYS